jgi:seryl-tRNA synthetase
MALPNLPHDGVPVGADETGNVEVRRWGTPRSYDFEVRTTSTWARRWAWTSRPAPSCRARASPSCAARWRGCTGRWRSSCWTPRPSEHGYTECYTPYIVNREALEGTGQLPKFKEDLFWVCAGAASRAGNKAEQYLIPPARSRSPTPCATPSCAPSAADQADRRTAPASARRPAAPGATPAA